MGVLVFLAATELSSPAKADDYGPPDAVAAVRHDLPLLLAAGLDQHERSTVDWVVTNDRVAIATWHTGQKRGLVALHFRYGVWWWRAAAATETGAQGAWTRVLVPGNDVFSCEPFSSSPPSWEDLLDLGLVDKALEGPLTARLRTMPPPKAHPQRECYFSPNYVEDTDEGFDATLSDVSDPADSVTLKGLPLPEYFEGPLQMETTWYKFSLRAARSKSVRFDAGSTLDVWFPFVLDSKLDYVLHLDGVPEVRGKFAKNVLRFVLPAFTLRGK